MAGNREPEGDLDLDSRCHPSVATIASFSIGQGFFTENPRISVAKTVNIGSPSLALPFGRSHSEQLVLDKQLSRTDVRLILGHMTTTAELAKLDPDNGWLKTKGRAR